MKKIIVFTVLVLALFLASCANVAPKADSDSDQAYSADSRIPIDDNVYTVTGKVIADIGNLTQTQAKGSMSGYGSQYGMYASGSYAMWQEGKGFVRLDVTSISPGNDIVQVGQVVIIKTTDQKVMALLPGDEITFKCRMQYEAIAAVRERETFDSDKVETWELDYCRMVTPRIGE